MCTFRRGVGGKHVTDAYSGIAVVVCNDDGYLRNCDEECKPVPPELTGYDLALRS